MGCVARVTVDFAASLAKVAAAAAASPSSFICIAQWVAHFPKNDAARCHPALQCRRLARQQRGRNAATVDICEAVLAAGTELLSDARSGFERDLVRKPTRSPMWTHAGMHIAADASTSWGWGV